MASSAVGSGASDEVDAGGGMASGRVAVGAATKVVGCGGATMSSSSEEVDAEGSARMEESRVVGGRVMAEGRIEGMPVSDVVRNVGRGSSEEAARSGIGVSSAASSSAGLDGVDEGLSELVGRIVGRSSRAADVGRGNSVERGDAVSSAPGKGKKVGVGTPMPERRSLKKSAMMKVRCV